jgi:hypothetical protein
LFAFFSPDFQAGWQAWNAIMADTTAVKKQEILSVYIPLWIREGSRAMTKNLHTNTWKGNCLLLNAL